MKRCNVVRVLFSKVQAKVLETLGDRCAALWNAANFRCRRAFLKGEPVPSYATLCAEFQGHPAYKALPSDIAQEVLKKLRKAWNSFFALLRLWKEGKLEKRPGLPGYWKDCRTGKRLVRIIPVKSPRSYSLDARTLSLTLPKDLRDGNGRLVLHTKGVLRFSGTPKTLELRHDRVKKRWYAHQVVEVPEPARKTRPEKYAALDLGARVLAALAVEGLNRQILFSGRKIWKDFLYWTKRIAEEQSRLNQAGRKTSRQLRRLYQVRARRLRHAFVALAAEVVRVLKRHRVTTLFLENLTGIREDMDFGPGNLLVHNFWAFRMLRNLIEAACTRAGIKIVPVEPRGTSSRCAVCGSPVKRLVRHRAVCERCGRVWHADANAALNILHQGSSKGHGAEATPLKPLALRWNRHRWVSLFESAAGTLYAASGSRMATYVA
ncbi:RNA-guided endonuclease InsQ/TnpB family protein [Desulfofundulus thermocisternus]|uniref:RNA-guided endonuclease InsQ/TnpB family protein n=1 Tax=Desulfofundulus thermocisternus TaxID=42471 RepID=UPI00217D79A6|nr:transposase [Desulfofundulus thermocisternus]MCS5696990.1 transposase [Desulfofundulus thermocisternus]